MGFSSSMQEAPAGPNYDLDQIRLSFLDPRVERIFEQETLHQSIGVIRLYLAAGTLLYMSFGVLDFIVCRQSLFALFAIRYGFVCPVILVVLGLTFTSFFERVGQVALSSTMI